jgi:hypothetical protein
MNRWVWDREEGKQAPEFASEKQAQRILGLLMRHANEAHSVPTHNGFGPDDGYDIKDARKATIEPNEQGAVGPAQI